MLGVEYETVVEKENYVYEWSKRKATWSTENKAKSQRGD